MIRWRDSAPGAASVTRWLLLLGLLLAGPLAAQDVATVQLHGRPVFTVAAGAEQSAAARARAIEVALLARLETDEPLAPIQVATSDSLAALVIGQDTLVRVTPRDAEVVLARAVRPEAAGRATRQVAQQWAAALGEVFLRVALRERARVVVEGTPLFEVSGTPQLRAARRAAAVGVRIAELVGAEPMPRLRVVERRRGAAVLAGDEVLVEVSPTEAAAAGLQPAELAKQWAGRIGQAVETLRLERSWRYQLRVVGIAVAATLLVLLFHLSLRRVSRRLSQKQVEVEPGGTWLAPVLVPWLISLVQFVAWAGLVFYVLWLVPRTRPLAYAASAQALGLLQRFLAWLLGDGAIVGGILLATFFAGRFVGAVIRQLFLVIGARRGGRTGLRAETLAGTVGAAAQLLVGFAGLIAILSYLQVDAVPLLASAGVAGIALGFGVQSLIRDFFTGLFILLEDQYGVGDLIRVRDITGKVERFTLRITQVRSLDGSLTSIPNGEITTVTNLSKDWSQVVLDVNIALGEDVDRATAVIAETAHELTQEWGDRIQGEPEVLGVETVDPLAQAITIRVVLRTAPLERWTVSRELRRRVLDAFREGDIQVPPRAVVTLPGPGV